MAGQPRLDGLRKIRERDDGQRRRPLRRVLAVVNREALLHEGAGDPGSLGCGGTQQPDEGALPAFARRRLLGPRVRHYAAFRHAPGVA